MTVDLAQSKHHDNDHQQNQFVHQNFLHWAQVRPNDIFLRQIKQGKFEDHTFEEIAQRVFSLIGAWQQFGLGSGDKIAILSKNCAEWFITDLACMIGGFVSVPIFPTAGEETLMHCLTHSESRWLVIGKLDDPLPIQKTLRDHPNLVTMAFDYPNTPNCNHQFHDLTHNHLPNHTLPTISSEQLMSIVYTSGTSGLPKGAMLTYGQYAWTVAHLTDYLNIEDNDRLFSYLPLAHITERVYIFGIACQKGLSTAFPESLDTFTHDLNLQQPTLFISVPRLWQLFQQRILEKLPQKKLTFLLKIPFIKQRVKNKIRQGLGLSQARLLGTGSAPISDGLLKWYQQLDMPLIEAWGMTENFAYSTMNYPYRADKLGSVGKSAPDVTIKLVDDHEIWIKSPALFSGYYRQKNGSSDIDENGWLHTGDIGSIDNEGYLTLQGRKKDTFKTAKGKFVTPVPIEKIIQDDGFFEQCCLIGSGMISPILLANTNEKHDKFIFNQRLEQLLEKLNSQLESHSKIRGIFIIKESWDVASGLLTPTLKIKRHLLEKQYHYLDQRWPNNQKVVWEYKQPLF
jgi:long-subunit acyl-CoA synthetase (AMP-forming)